MNLTNYIKEKTKETTRNINLDLIKTIAILFVVSVHFYLNTDFYSAVMKSKTMYLMSIFRTIFITCVPLFMMATGFLMKNKKLEKKHYKKISKVLMTYVIASIISLVYKTFYLKMNFTLLEAIEKIFNYTANNYAWYVEMYIGLYLLIPFINMMYDACKSVNQKITLIFVMCFLTIAPTFFNLKWILIPYTWTSLYPITYYLIGAFLSEYKINISKKINVLFIMLSAIVFGTLNYKIRYGETFAWGTYADYYGFEVFIMSVLIFNFLLNLDLSKTNNLAKKSITKISKLSLGMYLSSYIFDTTYYQILNENKEDIISKFKYIIIIVPAVFLSSIILAQLIEWIKSIIEKCTNKIFLKEK